MSGEDKDHITVRPEELESSHNERLALLGKLAASITHELRNPLTVIKGFMQLLISKDNSENQAYYKVMMEELDRMNAIIDDFLTLGQKKQEASRSANLNGIIAQLEPLLSAEANMRGHTLKLQLSRVPELVLYEREIKQLLLNLVRNGLEAMESSGVLTIETRASHQFVELSIADTGRGMPPEARERLFEPFFSTKSGGTGLGLPVCLKIAARHHAAIDIESAEGKGTTVTVTFERGNNQAEG